MDDEQEHEVPLDRLTEAFMDPKAGAGLAGIAMARAERRIAKQDPRAGVAITRWTRVGGWLGLGTCLVAVFGALLAADPSTITIDAADRSKAAVVVALMLLLFSGVLYSLALLLKAAPTPDEANRDDLSSVVQIFVVFGVYAPLVVMIVVTFVLGGAWWVVRLLGVVVLVVVGLRSTVLRRLQPPEPAWLSSLPPVRLGRYHPAHARRGQLLAPWSALWFGRRAPLWMGLLAFGGTLAITVASAARGMGLYALAVIGALLCGLATGLGAVHQRRRVERDLGEFVPGARPLRRGLKPPSTGDW